MWRVLKKTKFLHFYHFMSYLFRQKGKEVKFKNPMFSIIVSTNIGLLGKHPLKDHMIRKRSRLIDTCTEIEEEHGKLDALLLQESGVFDFEPIPWFNLPISTSSDVTYGRENGGTRGVCTYLRKGVGVDTKDLKNEITSSLLDRKTGKSEKAQITLLNIYRNQHSTFKRTEKETIEAIINIQNMIFREHKNVNKFIWIGDFNDVAVNVNDFPMFTGIRELKHKDMYHRHQEGTEKKFIDHVFTNIKSAEIVQIKPSCENVHGGDDTSTDRGHKVIVVKIGKGKVEKEKRSYVNLGSLKENAKSLKWGSDDTITAGYEHVNLSEKKRILKLKSNKLTEVITELVKKSTKEGEFRVGTLTSRHSLISQLEKDSVLMNSDQQKAGRLYKFMSNVKAGIDDNTGKKKPNLEQFQEKLQKKLTELNVADIREAYRLVDKIYGGKMKKKVTWAGQEGLSLNFFKRAVLGTSNSGATDIHGVALKHTKIIFDFNDDLLKDFRKIIKLCFETGIFPEVWKNDVIFFIYKRKGLFSDASNWRPITIACSIGKHLEKVIIQAINQADDRNYENHAYTGERSTMTAILDVQRHLRNIRNMKAPEGYEIIPVIGADDISSAFESAEHKIVARAIGKMIDCHELKIDKLVESYLERKMQVTDRKGNFLDITKRFDDKSTPQGSLLSPKLWRIYDNVFTELYREKLQELQLNTTTWLLEEGVDMPALYYFGLVSFADDHITVKGMLVRIDANRDYRGGAAYLIIEKCRDLIQEATKNMGCGVNPAKSESLTSETLIFMASGFKSKFKWLGYHLELTKEGLLWFSSKEVETKLKSTEHLIRTVLNTTRDLIMRFRVYQIYASCFVNLYLALTIQNRREDSIVHKFQHRMLRLACNAPYKISAKFLRDITGEKSVERKAANCAIRLTKYINSELNIEDTTGDKGLGETEVMRLRGGKRIQNKKHDISKLEDKDMIRRIRLTAMTSPSFPSNEKFDASRVRYCLNLARRAVKRKIKARKEQKTNNKRKKRKRNRNTRTR